MNNDAQLLQQLQVVNTDDGKLVGPGVPLSSHLIDACLGWDNRTVAATWIGDKFGVWDVATAKAAFEPIRLPGRGLSIAARPASPHFAVRCSNHLLVIDGRTGQTALEILTAHNSVVREYVRYTPDGRSLVHKRDWTISIHDADTGQLRFPPLQPQKGGVCRSIAVSADSRLLATVTGDPNFAQVWDLTTGRAASPPLHHPGEFWGLFSVRFSPDGRHLLTGHKDGQVRYWDWQTGRLACPPMAHSNEVYDAAITPDGRFAVTAVRGEPWHIEVWELTTGKRIASPVHLPLEVWELTTGKWIAAPPLAPRGINGATMGCARLTITPDGRRALVTSQYQHLAVVDLEALLSQPPMPTAELKQQAELATSHRLEAGDRNRLSLDDWKRLWAALPRHGPQRPWLQASGWPPDPKLTVDQTLSFLNQRLKQRPEDVRALYQRWEIRKDKEDRAQLIELCQRRPTGDLDEDAAFVLAEILNDLEWSPLTPVEMTAQSGTKLTLQPGGSILTAATKAARDSYRVRATSALRRITALQVQALPHRTLPEGGPGWGGGNFHLTEVRAFRQQPSQEPVPLQFATAQANYIRPRSAGARPRDGPLAVLDGDHGTRWDVHPLYGKAHWLNLCLNEAVLLSEGEQIVVELDCQDRTWPRALLGHFRLNVSGDERLTRRGLTQQIPRDLPVSAHVRLAAAYLEQGEPDQAQTTLARFEKPRFPSDHVAQPLLLIALHERLKQPRQAKEAYDLLLARLRDHAVPPALRPWALDALTSVGGLSQKDATAKLNHLALDLEWRGVTESLARRTDLNGVLRTDLHAVVRGMALLAWFGRDKEYNAVRGRLLDLAGTIEDADRAQDVVEACSLLPAGGAQQEAVLALGRRAVELGKGSGALPWFQMSLGMAQYRSGQFADAIRTLTTAGADSNQWISGTSACYRAMSLFRQGKKDEARKLAAEAARTMRPPPKDEDEVFSADHDDLILWLAHREAKALIGLEDAK